MLWSISHIQVTIFSCVTIMIQYKNTSIKTYPSVESAPHWQSRLLCQMLDCVIWYRYCFNCINLCVRVCFGFDSLDLPFEKRIKVCEKLCLFNSFWLYVLDSVSERMCADMWKSVLESLHGSVPCLSDQVDCLQKIAVISVRWLASYLSPPILL